MDRKVALLIINKLGSSGTPPEVGVEAFSIGLDKYLKTIEDEYLNGILKNYHLSSFKLVVGNYGGGKTHFLYSVRNLAFKHGYVVVYVSLNPTECPFDKLELVYKQIINNIQITPPTKETLSFPLTGIEAFIEQWYSQVKEKLNQTTAINDYLSTLRGIESSSFLNAIKGAFFNWGTSNIEEFNAIIQYLKGEEIGKEIRARYRISERIDKATAFRMIRSFIQWVHLIGYNGVVFLFDEAERGISMSSSKDKRRALDNLRQIVDECGNSRLPGAMFFYAIPDENLLLEGAGGVYEALKQRLTTVFSNINPLGVKIDLEELGISPQEFLIALGEKLIEIFNTAYDFTLAPEERKKLIKIFSERSAQAYGFDISYRRLFIVTMLGALQRIKNEPEALKKILSNPQEVDRLLRITSRKLISEEQRDITETEF
ncbi:MAG: BREX system ATP-binding domain-containing protein [candidate division WOR-3 bacterium]